MAKHSPKPGTPEARESVNQNSRRYQTADGVGAVGYGLSDFSFLVVYLTCVVFCCFDSDVFGAT